MVMLLLGTCWRHDLMLELGAVADAFGHTGVILRRGARRWRSTIYPTYDLISLHTRNTNGMEMENKPDFVNSWDKSRIEAERTLQHFRTKDPHPVKSTLSLNGTRTLITQLTEAMAEMSKQIGLVLRLHKAEEAHARS